MAAVPIVLGVAAAAMAAHIALKAKENHDRIKQYKAEQAAIAQLREEQQKKFEESVRLLNQAKQAERELSNFHELEAALGGTRLQEKRKEYTPSSTPGAPGGDPDPSMKEEEKIRAVLREIHQSIEKLPEGRFKNNSDLYLKVWERLSDKIRQNLPVASEEIIALKDMIQRGLSRFQKEMEAASKAGQEFMERVDALVGGLAANRFLTSREEILDEIDNLLNELSDLANSGDLDWGALDLVEKRFEPVKERVEADRKWQAYRATLTESLSRNMAEMGYGFTKPFGDPESNEWLEAEFAVPDGERLVMAIQPGGGIAFQMVHESRSGDASLTEEEIAFYRRQEARWQNDFKELVRRLTKEGFSFKLDLARLAGEDSIPIAVVEHADEFIEEEADLSREQPALRRRDR